MRAVEAAVRRRVRGDEAYDVVQATWADLLQASEVPEDAEEFRRFVFGVARHKVFDHFRRQKREAPGEAANDPEQAPEPLSARDILRWAEGELPDSESKDTLEWMLREGDGEKLEHIARDANLPAPRVRQRVSRLRRFLRRRWAAELLLGGALLTLAGYLYLTRSEPEQQATPERLPQKTPEKLAQELRRHALPECKLGDARACLDELERAAALDPAGNSAPEVNEARRIANERLAPPTPAPTLAPTPAPTLAPTLAPTPAPSPSAISPKPTPVTKPAPRSKVAVPPHFTSDSLK